MELFSMLLGSLDGRGIWGRMDTCICMAESLHCPPGTMSLTTLLISYTPIQNEKFKKKKYSFRSHKQRVMSIPIQGGQTSNELRLQPLNPTQHWSH